MGIVNILLLLGTLHGFIISIILIVRAKENRIGFYSLAIFLAVLGYDCLETFMVLTKQFYNTWFMPLYGYTFIHLAPPAFYLYISSYWRKVWDYPIWKYFSVFILFFLIRTVFGIYILMKGYTIKEWVNLSKLNLYYNIISICIIVFFCWFVLIKSTLEFRYHKKNNFAFFSNGIKKEIENWIKTYLWVFAFLISFWTINIILIEINHLKFNYYIPLEILTIILIYWFSFYSSNHYKVIYIKVETTHQGYFINFESEKINQCLSKIQNVFEVERIFLDQELTIQKLSEKINENPRLISAILNQKLNKGFNEFVNEYRVAEAIKQLQNISNKNLTIAAIAFEVGFNSLATFQRVFKQITGETPKKFLRKNN